LRGERIDLVTHGSDGDYVVEVAAQKIVVARARLADGILSAEVDGQTLRVRAQADARHVFLHDGQQRLTLARLPAFQADDAQAAGSGNRVLAPMPGRIVLMKAQAGDSVAEGQELGVMEAMKMELSLKAPRAGVIAAVQAAAGDFVEADAVLFALED